MNVLARQLAPIGVLIWSRRLALPATMLFALGGSLALAGALIRLDRSSSLGRDADLAALFAAGALVMLPAVVGVFAGDVLQQLARRPSLRLLPGLRSKLALALGLIGALVCLGVALAAAPFRVELGVLSACAPAALGFALGALFPGHTRNGLAWAAAIALPPLLAEPLCRAAGNALVAALMVTVVAALLGWQVARLFRSGVEYGRAVTWLQPLAPETARRDILRQARRRAPGDEFAPPEHIADLRGWRAAHRFEQSRAAGTLLTTMGGVRCYLAVSVVALISPLLRGLTAEGPGPRNLLAVLLEALVAPGETVILPNLVTSIGVIALSFYPAAVAMVAASPLVGELLYPLSRRERADLAWTIGVLGSLRASITALLVGGLVAWAGLAWLGSPWPRELPVFAWVAFVGLATAPWFQALALALARRMRRRTDWRAWVLFGVGLNLAIGGLGALWDLWVEQAERRLSLPIVVGYVIVLAIGYAANRPLLRRHYARCDLAG